MATPNRTALLTKTHKVLKKYFKPCVPPEDRPVLEHILFACCLENASFESAQQAFEKLKTSCFDWNEVRVSTVKELAEVMHVLRDAETAASKVKRVLQSVFESSYSFDLEGLKKLNLGQALARMKKIDGMTPFVSGYATQATLGGHAIPVDRGAIGALTVIGVVGESKKVPSSVPGLERAIPKSKGVEFGSLLHHLAAEFDANPYAPALQKILLEINPEAKPRLPKRQRKKSADAAQAPATSKSKTPPAKKTAAAKQATPARNKPQATKKPARKSTTQEKAAPSLPRRKPR